MSEGKAYLLPFVGFLQDFLQFLVRGTLLIAGGIFTEGKS